MTDVYCEAIPVTPTAPEAYVDVYNIAFVDANGNEIEPIQCGGTPVYLVIFLRWQNTTRIYLKVTCGPNTGKENTLLEANVDLPSSSGDGCLTIGDQNGNPFDPRVVIEPCCGSCNCNEFTICAEAG